eukprot:1157438-Pelagomonas_calceolata.AAC.6
MSGQECPTWPHLLPLSPGEALYLNGHGRVYRSSSGGIPASSYRASNYSSGSSKKGRKPLSGSSGVKLQGPQPVIKAEQMSMEGGQHEGNKWISRACTE